MAGSAEGVRAALARAAIRAAILAGLGGLLYLALTSLPYRWQWRVVWEQRGPLLEALWLTVLLSLGAMALGVGFGIVGCVLRIARYEAASFLGACYVELIRNTPLLVQLYIAYFCIASALRIDSAPLVGAVALGVFAGAYITEILRAGVESIERGQTEAALSLGLTRTQALIHVIGPQAFRRVIPPLAGQFVSLVKDSSLLSTISIVELTYVAKATAQRDYRLFEFYLAAAALYTAMTFPLSRLSVWLERRLDPDKGGRR